MAADTPTSNAVQAQGDTVFEGGVNTSQVASLSDVLNVPWELGQYFQQLAKDPKKAVAPKTPELTGDKLAGLLQPKFEVAAQSDRVSLGRALAALKLGQALLKFSPEPPFWAAGFARSIPEEDLGDDADTVEEDSPNNDSDNIP